jgi:cobalt-zinc-cadmium efflux system outer membrane protein
MNYVFLIWVLFVSFSTFSQDTLRINWDEAQKSFLDNNLPLIIQKFNIEASKAQILQAKLYANPNVTLEQGLISRSVVANGESLGPYAQRSLQVQQLFLLAGKRNKNIQMARLNAQMTEYEFFDLMRTLIYSLNSNFFELAFQLKTVSVYQQEATTIRRLVVAYRELQKDGNAALKDVVRLESSLFSLESDLYQLELAIAQNQADLRVLLGMKTNTFLLPLINDNALDSASIKNHTLDHLIVLAEENRYDVKVQETTVHMAATNLSLQKAYRIPDIILGYTYDRAGSYVNNYQGVTLQTNLPFFNRNQGNIQTADLQLKSDQKALEQARVELNNDVILSYTQALKTEGLYQNFDKQFVRSFNTLMQGVVEGYEKKTISLVEFMDFFDSYKQNVVQFNNLRNNRIQSYLKVNFSVAKNIFTF